MTQTGWHTFSKEEKKMFRDFPGSPVPRNPLANVRGMGSILVQKLRSHMSWGNWARAPQAWGHALQWEKQLTTMKTLRSFLEEAFMQQWRLSTAKANNFRNKRLTDFPYARAASVTHLHLLGKSSPRACLLLWFHCMCIKTYEGIMGAATGPHCPVSSATH